MCISPINSFSTANLAWISEECDSPNADDNLLPVDSIADKFAAIDVCEEIPVGSISPSGRIPEEAVSPNACFDLPSVDFLIDMFEGSRETIRNREGAIVDYQYDEIISVDVCNKIMQTYLQKTGFDIEDASSLHGKMISKEVVEDGFIVINGDLHANLTILIDRLKYLVNWRILNNEFKVISAIKENPNTLKILFLGDYFGRGQDGINLFMLLLLFKMENWEMVDLYRGNHETLKFLEKDLTSSEENYLDDLVFYGFIDAVFSSLILRGYYCCETKAPNNRKEHLVVSHGVPGYYPSALEVIKEESHYLSTSNVNEMNKEIEMLHKRCVNAEPIANMGSREMKIYQAVQQVSPFLKANKSRLEDEWMGGDILELWGDVAIDKETVGYNTKRHVSLVVSPEWIKNVCRLHSDADNRIVALIKGHGHIWMRWSTEEESPKEGFIHQQPIRGSQSTLDAFYIYQVKPKVSDGEVYFVSKKGGQEEYEVKTFPFYGNELKKVKAMEKV